MDEELKVPEALEETVEDGEMEVSNGGGRTKAVGTVPRTSGSRPTFMAAVALKLSAPCAKLATVLG